MIADTSTPKKSPDPNVVGKRIFAALIDIVLWSILFVIAAHLFGTASHDTTNGSNMYYANLSGIPALIFFLVALAYYVILEWKIGGTIGKLLIGIRVRDEKDEGITLQMSLIRNLLRIVDAFPYIIPNLVGLIVLASNDKKQRVGDKVAHTLVVLK